MNAGAYGSDVAATLDWAEIVTRQGELRRLHVADIGFSYRTSGLPAESVVVGARFRARPRRSRHDRRAHGGNSRQPRGDAADARPYRWLHLPQSARRPRPGN